MIRLNNKLVLFLVSIFSSVILSAKEPVSFSVIIAKNLFTLCFPFFYFISVIDKIYTSQMYYADWIQLTIFIVFPFLLSLYIMHRLLKKSYKVLMFRLCIIQAVQFVVGKIPGLLVGIVGMLITVIFFVQLAAIFGSMHKLGQISTLNKEQISDLMIHDSNTLYLQFLLWFSVIFSVFYTLAFLIIEGIIAYYLYKRFDSTVDPKLLKQMVLYSTLANYVAKLIILRII